MILHTQWYVIFTYHVRCLRILPGVCSSNVPILLHSSWSTAGVSHIAIWLTNFNHYWLSSTSYIHHQYHEWLHLNNLEQFYLPVVTIVLIISLWSMFLQEPIFVFNKTVWKSNEYNENDVMNVSSFSWYCLLSASVWDFLVCDI